MKSFLRNIGTLLKYRGILEALKWACPIHTFEGHWFIMRPRVYGGQFSWQSINKYPGYSYKIGIRI